MSNSATCVVCVRHLASRVIEKGFVISCNWYGRVNRVEHESNFKIYTCNIVEFVYVKTHLVNYCIYANRDQCSTSRISKCIYTCNVESSEILSSLYM